MSDASGKAILQLDGKDYIVKELTVAELRELFNSQSEYELLRHNLFESIYLVHLPLFINASLEELEQLRPSQLESIIGKIREMNPSFFNLLARMKEMTQPAQ